MPEQERKEIEEIFFLKRVLEAHNQLEGKIKSMTPEEHLEYRLDIMERIDKLMKTLNEKD